MTDTHQSSGTISTGALTLMAVLLWFWSMEQLSACRLEDGGPTTIGRAVNGYGEGTERHVNVPSFRKKTDLIYLPLFRQSRVRWSLPVRPCYSRVVTYMIGVESILGIFDAMPS
jgi:hypothetical protein